LLWLKIFKVEVLEILRQLALYAMIDRPEISNIQKINQTEQQIEEFQYDDAMVR
jgi:predicted YcjX-like family ATPase